MVLGLLLGVSACDTGDGKQLEPVDPADIPASTDPPATTVAIPFTGDGDTGGDTAFDLSLIHISEPTRPMKESRIPS